MDIGRLHRFLESATEAESWLRSWGLEDVKRAHANLVNLATAGITLDLLAMILQISLSEHLPRTRAIRTWRSNNLERFVAGFAQPAG